MSKTDSFPKKELQCASTSSLSPVLELLSKLEGRLDEKENQQLLDDLLAFLPMVVCRVPCAGRETLPAESVMSPWTLQAESSAPAEMSEFSPGEMSPAFSRYGNAEEILTEIQETFAALQEYYPLRAATLYLRFLCRIWVGLVEEKKLDIMGDDDFIRSYLDAMFRVEAITARCERCTVGEGVGLQ